MKFYQFVIECLVVGPDVDDFPGFSHNVLAVLVYFSEMRNVSTGKVI